MIEFGADGEARMSTLPEYLPSGDPNRAGWADLRELEGMACVIKTAECDLSGLVERGWSYASLRIGDRPNYSPAGFVPDRWFGNLKTDGDHLGLTLKQMMSNHSITPNEFTLVRRSHTGAEP